MIEKSKYYPPKHRLEGYDYSTLWWYFVTICTYNHSEFFGEIIQGKMIFNEAGKAADSFGEEIPVHFDYVDLDYHVIMPNHVHGIIILNEAVEKSNNMIMPIRNYVKPSPLGTIVRSYKSAVSKRLHELQGSDRTKIWQRNFYDRIIRNEKELYFIRRYIQLNPLKWDIEKCDDENLDL